MKSSTVSAARQSLAVSGGFVALLWFIEGLDAVLPGRFEGNGVRPRSDSGMAGILFGPLIHDDWAHLVGNSVPLLVLGFLLAFSGLRLFAAVTACIWLTSGLGVWLIGSTYSVHIGASGIVFGWIAYLVLRGVFSRDLRQIALGVLVLVVYGGALWGVLPGQPGISWEGHLFGAVGGAIAARWLGRGASRRQTSSDSL